MHMEMQFIQLLSLFSGTGSNAAFVEHLDNIERWTGDTKDPKQVALPPMLFSEKLDRWPLELQAGKKHLLKCNV